MRPGQVPAQETDHEPRTAGAGRHAVFPAQAFQAVPDRHGSNLYTTDSQLQPLLALYLPPEVNAHLQPIWSAWARWPAARSMNGR